MTGVTISDMSEVAAELRAALVEHDEACVLIGHPVTGAARAYKQAYLKAHAASTTFHPERTVKGHDVAAEEAAFEEWAELNALEYRLKALKERMHSLRQVLSAFQTQVRVESNLDGPPFEQRRAS